jgi:hypothetical protein
VGSLTLIHKIAVYSMGFRLFHEMFITSISPVNKNSSDHDGYIVRILPGTGIMDAPSSTS